MTENIVFKKGTVIFAENAIEYTMFDIISGKVGIYSGYGQEGETLLTELSAGRYFGEMGVIDSMPRSATAVALEDTEVVCIPGSDFESYFANDPMKVMDIFMQLCGRLRTLSEDYSDACTAIGEYLDAEGDNAQTTWQKIKTLLFGDSAYWNEVIKNYTIMSPQASQYYYF